MSLFSRAKNWLARSLFPGGQFLFFGKQISTGPDVTADTALGVSAFWRATTLISQTLASLPFRVVEVDGDDFKTVDTQDPLHNLVAYEPGPLYQKYGFWEALVLHALVLGNGLAQIVRDERTGRPTELILVDPVQVTSRMSPQGVLEYQIQSTGQAVPFTDMIHLHGPSWNGITGMDILWTHRRSISQAFATDDLLTNFYESGAFLSGYLYHPSKLTQEQADLYSTSFRTNYGGIQNSGKYPVLHGGMEFKPVQIDPVQAGSLDAKKLNVTDISRIFGVPTFMLSDMSNSSLNNFEQAALLFKLHTIVPWAAQVQLELSKKLWWGSPLKWKKQVFVDVDKMTLADLDSRSNHLRNMFNIGVMSTNEARKEVNLPKVENGDERFIPLNMAKPDSEQRTQPPFPFHFTTNGTHHEPS